MPHQAPRTWHIGWHRWALPPHLFHEELLNQGVPESYPGQLVQVAGSLEVGILSSCFPVGHLLGWGPGAQGTCFSFSRTS